MSAKAVVLAAGAGSRMGTLGAATPKPLLAIDGRDRTRTFLDWHLRALAAAGVEEIYLVGGPGLVGTTLAAMADVAATWIVNPSDPRASGSAGSAACAWRSPHRLLDGRARVLLMDADIVYEPGILADLVAAPGAGSKISVCAARRGDGEEVLVFGDPPRRLGKGLAGSAAVAGLPCLGEATGITLWAPEDHAALAAATEWALHHSARGPLSEHEDVTQRMMDEHRVRAVTFGAERVFLEVDTPEDYRRLVEEVAPALLAAAAT
jgi:choline kinase